MIVFRFFLINFNIKTIKKHFEKAFNAFSKEIYPKIEVIVLKNFRFKINIALIIFKSNKNKYKKITIWNKNKKCIVLKNFRFKINIALIIFKSNKNKYKKITIWNKNKKCISLVKTVLSY